MNFVNFYMCQALKDYLDLKTIGGREESRNEKKKFFDFFLSKKETSS